MKASSVGLRYIAIGAVTALFLAGHASAQTSMHAFHCGIDGKDYSDLTGTPCDPNRSTSSASTASSLGTAYGNAISAVLGYIFSTDPNAAARAAVERQRQEQLKLELERQREEALRQQRLAEARRLDEMIARLTRSLKLDGLPQLSLQSSGVPQLSLKLGGDTGNGYGICGLPGIATGGQNRNCPAPAAPTASGLKLKLDDAAAPSGLQLKGVGEAGAAPPAGTQPPSAGTPAVTAEQAANLFAQLSPEQQQQLLDLVDKMRSGRSAVGPDGSSARPDTAAAAAPAARPRAAIESPSRPASGGVPCTSNVRSAGCDIGSTPGGEATDGNVAPSGPRYAAPNNPVADTTPAPSSAAPGEGTTPNAALNQAQQAAADSQKAVQDTKLEKASVDAGRVFDSGSSATVDLRQAGTTTVDPARVRGDAPAAPSAPAPTAAVPGPVRSVYVTAGSPANVRGYDGPLVPVAPAPRPAPFGERAATIASSGVIPQDADKVCDYVEATGGSIVVQNVHYGDRAWSLIHADRASAKPLAFKPKSTLSEPWAGLIPVNQQSGKLGGDPKKIREAQAWIQACIREKKCTIAVIDGMQFLADADGKPYVSDYDTVVMSYGGKERRSDLGVGTADAERALRAMNAMGLKVPFTNLDAAHNPDCVKPELPLGATAFERDAAGQCRVIALQDFNAVDAYRRSQGIPACWDASAGDAR